MATEQSKVAGVADAVRRAKGKGKKPKAAKKRHAKPKPKATPTPRKKKGATKKPADSTAAEKRVPTSGQSGPPINLSPDALNAKESKIFEALNGAGSGVREIISIEDLATTCFKSQGKKRSNSWVRNSLRRLIQAGFVEKVERGRYRISEAGRKRLARAA